MENGLEKLFYLIQDNVIKARELKTEGSIDNVQIDSTANRAVQLCVLDLILDEHRKKYGNQFGPLHGKLALQHKLLLKYNWPLTDIRALTLADVFLALHDEITLENLEEDAKHCLLQITSIHSPIQFSNYIEDEWDPELAEHLI